MRAPILIAGLVLTLAACQQRAPAAPAAAQPSAPKATVDPNRDLPSAGGELAPDTVKDVPSLEVTTVDGAKWSLAQRRGKWVVVNFWATWCTPCLAEIPELEAFDKARADVEVIGLDYEEIEKPDMDAFLKGHPISYPIATIDVYKGVPDFPIPRGLPMSYVISPEGKVVKQVLGPVDAKALAELVGPAPGAKS